MMNNQLRNWKKDALGQTGNKRVIFISVILALTFLFLVYLYFGIWLNHRVIISFGIPYFILSLLFSSLVAFLFSFSRKSMIKITIKNLVILYFDRFWRIFIICFVITNPLCNYYIYFFPDNSRTYLTEYKIVSPGPRTTRFSRCDDGILIKDQYTSDWFFLCFKKNDSLDYSKQALVTIRNNAIGSYLFDYELLIID